MRTANDFEKCVSALKTTLINKKNKLDELNKVYVTLEVDSVEELEVEKKIDSLAKDYREALKSYNEALELL